MVDRNAKAPLFSHAWTAFGNQSAALLGITVGLLCLLNHVPVWLASLRGGLAFLSVWFIVRCATFCVTLFAHSSTKRAAPDVQRKP